MDLTGQTVSHYCNLSKIGEGGMGIVYKAEDTKLHRTVALKFLPENAREGRERFLREARAAAALNHPNICTVFEIDEERGFIAMELVEGPDLKKKIAARPLPFGEALDIAMQACGGLQAAHEKGIVHRDIKPANLMITAKGQVKIMDFGLAQIGGATQITQSGASVGTPAYMSPEQAEGQPTDRRTDIWSIGVVLYEMLAGVPPFSGQTAAACAYSIVHTEPEPLTALRSGLSRDIDRVINKALCKDPAGRYQHAEDLLVDLRGLSEGSMPTAGKIRNWKPAAAVVAAMALFAAGYYYWPKAPKLTDKDTLVLADFVNTTGDPVFDGTLRQGLAIQLEQSPFLKIMDEAQVQRNLRLMNQPRGARITSQVAHDICVRDGAAATIDGTIAGLGSSYVITLEAIQCQNGVTLAREQVQARDKEQVLRVLGEAVTAMRAKLGESLASIEKLNRPLEQATTGSLESLQSYTKGFTELSRGRFLDSRPWFERAVQIDPDFAMAYRMLAIGYNNAGGDAEREAEYRRKAFALRGRASEYERFLIEAGDHESRGESDKIIESGRAAAAIYPRSWPFRNLVSEELMNLGFFEEALKHGQIASQLQPNAEPPYRRLLDAYLCLNRLDEAKKVAGQVRAQGIDGARIHQRLLEMAYVEGDLAAADKEMQWFAGKPEAYLSFGLQAAYRNTLGQRLESNKLYKLAAESALNRKLKDVAAALLEADARAAALTGECGPVRRLGRAAMELALCGDIARAEQLAAETSKQFPNGTIWNSIQLPAVRAAIAIHRGQPAKAIELLAPVAPHERAYPGVSYLRGLANLRLQKGSEAAAEFQKVLDHKSASWAATWRFPNWGLYYSISYVGLARARVIEGDTARARKAYQEFFALWKDADPGVPILREAKAEFAKLR